MKLTIDLKVISIVLLAIIAGMLLLWKPWQGVAAKTITVTGESTVSAAPDEFIFSPTYQKKADNVTTAINDATKQGNEVVAKLKEMGVADNKIKTTITSNPDYDVTTGKQTNQYAANYSVTATVNDKDLAQKVLDYLVTTPALYGISPQSTFSKETRKKLEAQVRPKALADAKEKAKQTTDELDVRLGRVTAVTENGGFGGPITLEGRAMIAKPGVATDSVANSSPTLQTGTEDINFTVNVVYRIY